MIDKNLVKRKVALIQTDLSNLAKYERWTIDQIAADYVVHKAVERMIEVIINEAIDINQHIIVQTPQRDLPFDFKKSFLLLADLGVYPADFAQKISQSVGLRNILVHQYRQLDEEKFYDSIKQCLTDYSSYCTYVLTYLSR